MEHTDITKSTDCFGGWLLYQGWDLRYYPQKDWVNGYNFTISIDVQEDPWEVTFWKEGGNTLIENEVDIESLFQDRFNPTESERTLALLEFDMPYPSDISLLAKCSPENWPSCESWIVGNSFILDDKISLRKSQVVAKDG